MTAGANVPAGPLKIDVTSSVRAWAAGEPNWGWALLPFPGGTNGITFASAEAATAAVRPQLTVSFTPPPGTQGTPVPTPTPLAAWRPRVIGPLFRDIVAGPLSVLGLARLKRTGITF